MNTTADTDIKYYILGDDNLQEVLDRLQKLFLSYHVSVSSKAISIASGRELREYNKPSYLRHFPEYECEKLCPDIDKQDYSYKNNMQFAYAERNNLNKIYEEVGLDNNNPFNQCISTQYQINKYMISILTSCIDTLSIKENDVVVFYGTNKVIIYLMNEIVMLRDGASLNATNIIYKQTINIINDSPIIDLEAEIQYIRDRVDMIDMYDDDEDDIDDYYDSDEYDEFYS